MQNIRGFTLVEILIVVGIVALLGALLVPVFFKARVQGQKTTCQSNLHQVHVALRQYADDNEGSWPNGDTWGNKSFAIVELNGCPQAAPATRPYNRELMGISGYAYNTAFTQIEHSQFVGINDQKIRFPATTVAVCEEAIGRHVTYGPDPMHNTGQTPSEEEKGWLRHNSGANYLFADGHIKWYLPNAVGYNETPNTDAGIRPTFALTQTK